MARTVVEYFECRFDVYEKAKEHISSYKVEQMHIDLEGLKITTREKEEKPLFHILFRNP